MKARLLFAVAILFAALFQVTPASAIPDAGQSTVDPCLIICPDGDFAFTGTVRDAGGIAVAGAEVVVDFCSCPNVLLCSLTGGDNYILDGACKAVAITNGSGEFIFNIRGGGICETGDAIVSADGVQLALRVVHSPDLDGNLAVEDPADTDIFNAKFFAADPIGVDYNCDLAVTVADLAIFQAHLGHACTSAPDAGQSTVDPCLVICPGGDIAFNVIVRDVTGSPIVGSEVMIDFCLCDDVYLCEPNQNQSYQLQAGCQSILDLKQVILQTDGTGMATFNIEGGGLWEPSDALILADGVLLAMRLVASPDQNGNGGVAPSDRDILEDKSLNTPLDLTGDLDCSGVVDGIDFQTWLTHSGHLCLERVDVGNKTRPSLVNALLPALPNPALGSSTIRFSVASTQRVNLVVYDPQGRVIRRLLNGEADQGVHVVVWDCRDERGSSVSPGVYFVHLSGAEFNFTEKMVLTK